MSADKLDEIAGRLAHGIGPILPVETVRAALAEAVAAATSDMLEALKEMEWASYVQGAGYGPHSSGGDGPMIPACPSCRGVHPEKGRREFIASACGHTKACKLDAAIAKAEGR